jgi:3-oxoacyl-[acyl-carrier protein] reductase
MSENPHKWLIVSGVSRGLGLAMARDLLAQGYGVAGCSTSFGDDLQALIDVHGDQFFWANVDMADTKAIEGFVTTAVTHFADHRLWGVVNNAGMSVEGILSTLPVSDIEHVLQVNLTGAICLARAALRQMMKARKSGRVINISSITGLRGYTGLSAYAASKAGLDGFSRPCRRGWMTNNSTRSCAVHPWGGCVNWRISSIWCVFCCRMKRALSLARQWWSMEG